MAELDPRTRFRDPAAAVVWAGICALEEGAQHDVLDLLAERLASADERDDPHTVRVARAVAALREVATILGHAPTVREYREQRETHPERQWPPDGTIRTWLGGGWNQVLLQARLEAVPEPEASVDAQGPNLSKREVLDAIKACASDLEVSIAGLSYSTYLNWSRSPAVRKRPGRRPKSQSPFDGLGGWRQAKTLALGGEQAAAEDQLLAAGANGRGYRYTDEQLFAAADEIGERLGTFPVTTKWARERQAILDAEAEAGKPPRAFPSLHVIWKRYGSWGEFREAYEARGEKTP